MKHIHGTCLSIDGCGVILRGPPSSGKSDLALRLIKEGAQLVADDQIVLSSSCEGLFASAPKKLAGLIEVRGVGIIKLESVENVRVDVVVDLVKRNQISRVPDFLTVEVFGVSVPSILLFPFDVSASTKLTIALKVVKGKSVFI
ncbi:MAG: HPr kinase/phosphorylase [Alphaproteobacteria bacterium MarineAlpha3_Bin5]|nr:serine/threonine protein kinase [Magnetovibrio sp.]PPR77474.1 MAG: HPr kinase/phosphorylase [Alphaproteobacteria bacterium MarineAlpha3_Bin5]